VQTGEAVVSEHRWSGWPGAWCLDCGAPDVMEVCVAEHNDSLICVEGHGLCTEHPANVCKVHVNGPCPEPGSKRCDPYARGSQ